MGTAICNVVVPFTNVLKRWTAFLHCTTLDKVYQCCTSWNVAQLCYNVWQRCNNVAQRWTMAALYNLKLCTALIQQRTALLQRCIMLDNVWQRCDNIAQYWITFGNVVQLPQRCHAQRFLYRLQRWKERC